MNTTGNKLTNEIAQLVAMLLAKGYTETKAIAFVAGLSYSFLDDTQKDELFKNVGRA
jgi:hypothetical protein